MPVGVSFMVLMMIKRLVQDLREAKPKNAKTH